MDNRLRTLGTGTPAGHVVLIPLLLAIGSLFAPSAAFAAPYQGLARGFGIEPDGRIRVGEVVLQIQHFAPDAKCRAQGKECVTGAPMIERDSWSLDGRYVAAADQSSFVFHQELKRTGPSAISCDARLTSPTAIPTSSVTLTMLLPVSVFVGIPLQVDDDAFEFPKEPFTKAPRWRAAKRIILPMPQGKLIVDGPVDVQLHDGRTTADKLHLRVRFPFAPEKGELTESSLSFSMRLEPYRADEKRPAFPAPVTIAAGEDWKPLEQALLTQPGSLLDWSCMNEKPAGRHGAVVIRDGHFELEGQAGTRLRLMGTNICDRANYLLKPQAEALAAQLARQGYNAARIHHYDRHLVKPGQTLQQGWDQEAFDKLDYLFHCLKREGLYVTIDLYTVRDVLPEELGGFGRKVNIGEFKALVAISPEARANWKEFARRVLTHVNPYTHLAWKDDPALFGICLLNEDDTTANWDSAPDIAALYQRRFEQWKNRQPDSGRSREQQWAHFLIETHLEMTRDLSRFVKDLGTRALITDANYRHDVPLQLIRQELDYVDNHNYHDLKKGLGGPFTLPYGFHQRSDIASSAVTPRRMFATRIFGQPFTVTEFNYCYPNHFRAEGGALMGAYAALQDWDGIFRYAYAHAPQRALAPSPIIYLDNASDPINMLADRIATLLFRRGDVTPAATRFPSLFSQKCLEVAHPLTRPDGLVHEEFEMLGLLAQVGSVPAAKAAQWAGKVPFAVTREPMDQQPIRMVPGDGALQRVLKELPSLSPRTSTAQQRYVSETGELELDASAGRMSIVTPRTECFVIPGAGTMRGSACEIQNHGGPAVVCISAMDQRPLAQSKRMLVLHLTDVQNSGIAFRDQQHRTMLDWGKLPLLVRRGAVEVRVPSSGTSLVQAIGLDGSMAHEVACQQECKSVTFTASTIQPEGTFLLYEVVRR